MHPDHPSHPDEIGYYNQIFSRLAIHALTPDLSIAFLREILAGI
jgi:hypothetical protein